MIEDKITESREFIGVPVDDTTLQVITENCESITFKNNNLTKLPLFTVGLNEIKILRITQNKLTEIPLSIYLLVNLKILDLSDNCIQSISPGISSLTKLISLNLSFNSLKDIPSELGQMKALRFLYLRANEILRSPIEISELKELKVLDLRENPVLSNNLEDKVGHLYLRTVFGENLLLNEDDFCKLNHCPKIRKIIRRMSEIKIIALILALLILFFWIMASRFWKIKNLPENS